MATKWSTEALPDTKITDFGALLKDEYTVIYFQGKNVFGDMVYCYLKITFPDIERLQAAMDVDANFNISDFGTVLAAGKGEPSAEVKSEISIAYPMLDKPQSLMPAAQQKAPLEKKGWDEY